MFCHELRGCRARNWTRWEQFGYVLKVCHELRGCRARNWTRWELFWLGPCVPHEGLSRIARLPSQNENSFHYTRWRSARSWAKIATVLGRSVLQSFHSPQNFVSRTWSATESKLPTKPRWLGIYFTLCPFSCLQCVRMHSRGQVATAVTTAALVRG